MTAYGYIFFPHPQRGILTLDSAQTMGRELTEFTTAAEVAAFLAQHPEVAAVNFARTDMPRRPVPVEKLTEPLLRKYFRF